ncbi:MAG: hypothetical protein IE916_00195 [Epsilonproteobacteria bacterium]|nr:hypothetical protein [Campylobacterota bacterium]
MKKILYSSLLLISMLFAEINPENDGLKQEKIDEANEACKEASDTALCRKALMLQMNAIAQVHRGVDKNKFYSELSGDWISYLEEGKRQTDKMIESEKEMDASLDDAIASGINEYAAQFKLSFNTSKLKNMTNSYVSTLNNTALMCVVSLRTNTAILQDMFDENMAQELKARKEGK